MDVDTSWYTRYRSARNPDFGTKFPQAIKIPNQPAIPISNAETPPDMDAPLPPTTPAHSRMQVIACTAAFHFGYIEQGGSRLYATLINKASSPEVVCIGGSESQHFATWSDDAGNAANDPVAPVTDPVTGLTIPNLADRPRAAHPSSRT